jgi:succinate-semialdehyde dehydrogenase/glutarate-semialdehyde dehydrogenase
MSIYKPLSSNNGVRRLELRSPINMEPSGELVCATTEEVNEAVRRARMAAPAWAALSYKERAKYMLKMSDIVLDNKKSIMDCVISETGKARGDAFTMEIFSSVDALQYYAKNAAKFLKPQKPKIHGLLGLMKKAELIYQPLGVIGIITPWNGPFVLALVQSCQALMAGNTVVVKGSEVTPNSTKLVESYFRQAGLPADVFQVLMGDGETGADLVRADVDKISFTGSVVTGKKIGAACGERLLPFTLELGGKDAMIVCEDANLERAAQGAAIGSCMNSGHYCCGVERIYVMASVYDKFVQLVEKEVKALRQGPHLGDEEDVGAIFWDKQMDIIEDHVKDAVKRGAKVHVGGKQNSKEKGLYYLPTLITNVNHDMKIMRDETFGPIVAIMKVQDENEAIQLANDSYYGLSGTVWTANNKRAKSLAERMQTGSVCINDMTVTYGIPVTPFGGVKNSGLGMVNGPVGLRGYCQLKPLIYDKRPGAALASGYPYTKKRTEGMSKFADFLWRKTSIGRWLS